MPTTVLIPTVLRKHVDDQDKVELNGERVGDVMNSLTEKYPGLKKQLYNDDGKMRNFVNIFVNDEDIRYLDQEETPIRPNDIISIVPSIAGGV